MVTADNLKIVLSSSGGNLRQVADAMGEPINEIIKVAREHDIKLPSSIDDQFTGTQFKTSNQFTASSPKINLDSWLYDSKDHSTIFGIDVARYLKSNAIDTMDILRHFHGKNMKCNYCNDEAVMLHFCDGNKENILISNIEPICKTCIQNITNLPIVTISKEFNLSASHSLSHYKGKCRFDHGHTYRIVIEATKVIHDTTGMVLDFGELKYLFEMFVEDLLDHNNINTVFPEGIRTTAELMTVWVFRQLSVYALLKGITKVTVYETDTSKASITSNEMLAWIVTHLVRLAKDSPPPKNIIV